MVDLNDPDTQDDKGCELCSYTPGGCSFCAGTSAIDTLRARGGEGVIDANTVLARLTPTDPDTPEPDPQ